MADSETTVKEPKAAVGEAPVASEVAEPKPVQEQQRQQQVQVDDSHVHAAYANFCRVTGSPEELIIDFGLNPQPVGVPREPIKIDQRIVVNFYTAKRLLAALHMSIQRHEAVFGALETDVQKRIRSSS